MGDLKYLEDNILQESMSRKTGSSVWSVPLRQMKEPMLGSILSPRAQATQRSGVARVRNGN